MVERDNKREKYRWMRERERERDNERKIDRGESWGRKGDNWL